MDLRQLTDILHREGCSCVIYNNGQTHKCYQRGVKDLFILLKETPEVLAGAMVADKVIGKGAAAIMIVGRVKTIYADVISYPALELLSKANADVSFGECVANIINRNGTGICPVETLCLDCATAEECIPLIENFLIRMDPGTPVIKAVK